MDLTQIFSSSTSTSTLRTEFEGVAPFTNDLEGRGGDEDDPYLTLNPRPYLVFLLLTVTSLFTIIGNGLVVISIWKEDGLHSPTNYFIASLATADLLVGGVVIPFEALTELLGHRWLFGGLWCDLWRALDVLMATSSILNLCVISLDRYWAISEPFSYPSRMTPMMAGKLIVGVWACSGGISLPAILYWRWTRAGPFPPETCLFTEDPLYLLFSSVISFYLPLVVMLFTYFRIYRAAVRQTRSIQLGAKFYYDKELELKLRMRIHRGGAYRLERSSFPSAGTGSKAVSPTKIIGSGGGSHGGMMEMRPLTGSLGVRSDNRPSESAPQDCPPSPATFMKTRGSMVKRKLNKFSKEKKAAKTLGIVLGVFIICWMPFFVLNVICGFCIGCGIQRTLLFSLVTWLGWLNSAMNPFIYAARNPDFRRAFGRVGRMVCCKKRMELAATRMWSFIKR